MARVLCDKCALAGMALPDANEKWDARFVTADKNVVMMVRATKE